VGASAGAAGVSVHPVDPLQLSGYWERPGMAGGEIVPGEVSALADPVSDFGRDLPS
jgi:hypothetical protein